MNYRVLNIFVIFCFILVGTFASGWHFANDILPGTFSDGDFIFNGSVKIVSGNDICIDGGICLGAVDSLYLNKTAKAADSNLLDGVDSNRILTQKTDIPSGANLNNYVITGLYHQNGNANAAAGSNYPISLAGMLEVIEDGSMIYQKYHTYNSAGDIYFRTRYAGTWYAWKKTYTNTNHPYDTEAEIDAAVNNNGYSKSGVNRICVKCHSYKTGLTSTQCTSKGVWSGYGWNEGGGYESCSRVAVYFD